MSRYWLGRRTLLEGTESLALIALQCPSTPPRPGEVVLLGSKPLGRFLTCLL